MSREWARLELGGAAAVWPGARERAQAADGRFLDSVALPVNAPAGSSAVGLKADDADHLLFACGGLAGTGRVYDSRTGALVAQYQLAPNGTSLINDVVLTAHGAYFTDSYNPDINEIPVGPFGRLGRAVTIPLSGPVAAFSAGGLNLNGIAATADGNTLIVDNTVLDKLFTVNPVTFNVVVTPAY